MGTLTRKITASCSSSSGYKTNGATINFNHGISAGDPISGSISSATITVKNFKSWDVSGYFEIYIDGNYAGETARFEPNSSATRTFTSAVESPNDHLINSFTTIALKLKNSGSERATYFYIYSESSPSGGSQIEINANVNYSACGAPSTINLNGTNGNINVLAGTAITLSWSGASSGGTNNYITGYEVFRNGSSIGTTTGTSMSVSCPSAGQSYTYTVKTLGSRESSGQSAGRTVYAYTNPTPPNKVSLDTSTVDAGTNAILSWSGASNGSGNNIQSYNVYRSTSVDGPYTLVGSASGTAATVTASSTMGQTYYYKVQAVGQYSSSGLSDAYAELTSRVYSNVNPPTSVACTPNVIVANELVTLAWTGASGGTNTSVASYQVYRSTSRDSGYELLTSTTGTSVSVYAPGTAGSTYYYKIKAISDKSGFDSDLSSAYGYVSVPLKPNAPIINGAVNGKSYNPRPRVLAQVPTVTVEGVIQSVLASGWTASRENLEQLQKVVLRKDTAYSQNGTYTVQFVSRDSFNVETGIDVSVKYQAPVWTDDPVTAGTTAIKAAHMNELRQAIDDIRAWYGMPEHEWTEEIVAGVTSSVNWASHAIEIKEQIEAIQSYVNDWDSTNKALDISLPEISTFYAPKADVINNLREAIALL